MAFVQEPINYAKSYAKELANAYPYISHFGDIFNGAAAQKFRPVNGNGVWIPSMTVSGSRAVNRDQITGTFNRNFNVNWELKTMSMYREWDTIVDPMDIVETNEVATISNVTKTFNEFQKAPEMDAYAASKIAGFAAQFGGVDSTSLTSSNILAQWDSYLAYMSSQRVPLDRVRCKMTPSTYKLLKEAAGITRFVDAASGARGIDRRVAVLDGVQIEEVPEDLMKSAYDFTEGFEPSAGAKQIDILMYDVEAIVAPVVYETAMLTAPSASTKGKNVYYEAYYYDVFALNNRMGGIFAHMTAPSLGALTVTSAAGSATGDSKITVAGDIAGVYGTKLMMIEDTAAITVTYGAALPSGTWTEINAGDNNIEGLTASKVVTVAQVNKQNNFVVAEGHATVVVKA